MYTTTISHKVRCYGLLFSFILAAHFTCAQRQNRFYVGVGAGPDVSFNKTESNRPLPAKVHALQSAGVSFNFLLEYFLTKHINLQTNIKTAARKTGISYENLINERDAQGQPRGSHSGAAFIRNAPVHFNVGLKTELQPFTKPV